MAVRSAGEHSWVCWESLYSRMLVFIAIPVVFFAGLALIPVGIVLARRRVSASFIDAADRRASWRRHMRVLIHVTCLTNAVSLNLPTMVRSSRDCKEHAYAHWGSGGEFWRQRQDDPLL